MAAPSGTRRGIALGVALLAAACIQAWSYWPGIMPWDAVRQYDQALSGAFDDWHPPAMEWLWRQLTAIHSGPAPMLVVQLALYWTGFALLAGWAVRARRPRLALALAACALLPVPLALMGAVLKDCQMAGALMMATGLLAVTRTPEEGRAADGELGQRWRGPLKVAAILLLFAAATLRFNAFPACLPLLVALLPRRWRGTPVRLGVATLIGAVALVAAMPVANRLLHADRSGVELSLVIFDLGGVTEHSGIDAFPPQAVADPVAVNHGCYSPVKWDPYSWWVESPCPIGFESIRTALARTGASPYRLWAAAVLTHPLAYAAHRLAHFNINTRFLVHDEVERPVTDQSAPNDWHYRITPNPAQRVIDGWAVWSGGTPLGWPICWLALALGVLIVAPRLPSRGLAVPVALSAFLYGLSYLPLSVAAELRYHLWTMLGTAVAAAIATSELAFVPRRRLAVALAPLLVVTLLCVAWRLFPTL
jgi:hypothetical protein